MLPYQPNSDVLPPLPARAPAPAEVSLLAVRDAGPFFPRAVFSIFFFSAFASAGSSFSPDFAGAGFTFGEDFGEAFANTVFLGVGFGVGLDVCFGVAFAFGVGLAIGLRIGVDVAVGFGVGNWISLFAAVRRGFSSSGSSDFNSLGSAGALKIFTGDGAALFASAAPPSAPPIQTMFCAFEELLACRLQRINPTRRAICASAIRVTFRQKRASFDIAISLLPSWRCPPWRFARVVMRPSS